MSHDKANKPRKIRKKAKVYTRSIMTASLNRVIVCSEKEKRTFVSRKEHIMKTVLFALERYSEQYQALLNDREQGLDFMHPYKIGKMQNTVWSN